MQNKCRKDEFKTWRNTVSYHFRANIRLGEFKAVYNKSERSMAQLVRMETQLR